MVMAAMMMAALQDLANAHGDGLARNIFHTGEPPFPQLLAPAGLIQVYDDKWIFRLEVGRGVIEGQVAVLANADQGHIDGVIANKQVEPPALTGRVICIGFNEVNGS